MSKTKPIILAGIMLLLSFGLLWAGGGKETAAVQKVQRPLNFVLQGNPDTLDPQKTAGTLTFQTVKSFYDTLVEPDKSGKIVPALAESWTVSDDGLVWTFKLRSGVTFHNGDPLTSADVKASFERILDPAVASPKAGDFGPITSVATPDASTAVITLKTPFAPFIGTLASGWAAILPASLIQSGHDFSSQPVGTGPYIFQEWVRDGKITMKKNPSYWMPGLPMVETVVLNIIPELSVGVQGVLSGQLDIMTQLSANDLPILEASPDVTVEKDLSAMILVLSMNCSAPGLDDLRIRQAVNYAIDKQKVLDLVYGGGEITGTFMDPSNAYYKDFTGLYPYNPDKARSLLAQAGAAAQREFVMYLPQNYEQHVQAGEVYQEMLTKVGLNVKIQLIDWSTWLSDVYRGGKYDFTVIGHTGKLDPDGTLGGYGSPERYVRWNSPQALDLINKGKVARTFEERKALYDGALELMAKEVPFVFLGAPYVYSAHRNDVTGFFMTPKLDTFDFRWVKIGE